MSEVKYVDSFDELNGVIDNARDDGRRTVVLVTAPSWCGPCVQFEKHWKRAVEEVDDIDFVYIEFDSNQWVVEEMGVRSVPNVTLFDEEGIFSRKVTAPQGALPFMRDIRS